MAGTKLFVGSLPHGIVEDTLRAEFSKYGTVEDVYVKPNCEATKQWAFVTFTSAQDAQMAKEATDRLLQFHGAERPCDVMVAKNQGMFGQNPVDGRRAAPPSFGHFPAPAPAPQQYQEAAPRKIFVGSLPELVSEAELRYEFARYGQITDLFLNSKPVEPGRQWAFVTYASPEQAQAAKSNADCSLTFPGSEKPCEVTLARHQGMFGQGSLGGDGAPPAQPPYYGGSTYPAPSAPAPRKVFVGSLPVAVTESELVAEFSKYGQVTDLHINDRPCDHGRNWAFVTFATAEQANYAKDSTDRVLTLPGADRPCEVMVAKHQGRFGQDSVAPQAFAPALGLQPQQQPQHQQHYQQQYQPQQQQQQQQQPQQQQPIYASPPPGASQPPPPPTPPPEHLTPWRLYKTAAGLPYYHNHQTGVTQWECPPDLQVPGQASPHAAPPQSGTRYSPY